MIEQIAISRGHEIVSVIDIDNQEDFNSDAFKSADVAIEFTAPHVAYSNYLKAWAAGVKVVSGSTGWLKEHGDDVRKACEEEGKTLFWASNFSVGVAIFSAVSKYLAKIMNGFPQYDVSMEEVHHIHKLDHPSGTAITLAEGVISQLDRKDGWTVGEAARKTNRPTSCASTASVGARFLASIPSPTIRKLTASPSLTMLIPVKDSLWEPSWPLSTRKIIQGCSPQTTCSNFKGTSNNSINVCRNGIIFK